MNANRLRRLLASGTVLPLLVAAAHGQDPPFNTELVSQWTDGNGGFADIWGDGDFVYQARYNRNWVDILDLSDPSAPIHAATVTIGNGNELASAQDVKVGDGLMFVALEYANPDGAVIVDVRDPYAPQILTYVDPEPGSFEQIHNLYYDSGWLYLCNSSNTEIAIVDLRTYDPDNAPARLTTWAYRLTNVGSKFVHDITVRDGRLYCAAWQDLYIYDVSNLGSQSPQLISTTGGAACHAVWPTDDGAYVVTGEERKGGDVRLYQVIDQGGSLQLVQRDSVTLDLGESFSSHNPLVLGDRVYVSWYQAGAIVLEIDRDTHTFDRVAQYDTDGSVPFSFAGCWGVYPFLGEDRVLMSDLGRGTYVVDMSGLTIDVPAFPTTVPTSSGYGFTFDIEGVGTAVVDPSSVQVHYSVGGSEFVAVPAAELGGGQFDVTLPAVGCQGELRFYVSAADTTGHTYYDPAAGAEAAHRLWATDSLTSVFSDDFESDQGWIVDGDALRGLFVRVDPNGTSGQPEDDDPDAVGTRCFVTGQGPVGGDGWEDDLDGGFTSITSPSFDMSAGDGLLRYSYWFFNAGADDDTLEVELSNDDGASWVTVSELTLGGGGWRRAAHRVSDHLLPTATMRVRFTGMDRENTPTTTEIAIDEVHVELFGCDSAADVVARNGSGVNPTCLSSTNLPVLGTTWAARVDGDALPTATLTYLVSYTGPLAGVFVNAGELLVDPTSPFFFSTLAAPGADGDAVHAVAWPDDPTLVGFNASLQALLVGGGVQLCNALDVTLDD